MSALRVEVYVFLVVSFINLICDGKYSLKPVDIDRSLPIFSDAKIAAFDGSDPSKPLLMAIKGVVFDVSEGKGFYGKGSSYNALIGKDSSRGVAKMSLEPSDLKSDISGLDDETLKSLDDIFTGTYMAKYPVVGYMEYLIKDKKNKNEL